MANQIKVIRGMHDILPRDMNAWHQIEDTWRALVESYGYQQIRTPIIEKTSLFKRSIGEVTDIVEKEMYTFDDRNGESLSMRPEGTASVVRAGIENGLLVNQQQRLWYSGAMFRYERPETFGMPGADIEAELMFLAARFWKLLGLDGIHLQINTLGTHQARLNYKSLLVDYFRDNKNGLDSDSVRRLETNPLRILDSKNPEMQSLIETAPKLREHLDQESEEHFAELIEILNSNNLSYDINERLVRGLDYYSHTVFEWVTDDLGAQGTVCAGGRYDTLVEQLGGKPTTAAGFAMGIERLITLLQDQNRVINIPQVQIYFVISGHNTTKNGQKLSELLRDNFPDLRMIAHSGGGSFKSQMKKADKSGASVALILGESEVEKKTVVIKFLREEKPQVEVNQSEIISYINSI